MNIPPAVMRLKVRFVNNSFKGIQEKYWLMLDLKVNPK